MIQIGKLYKVSRRTLITSFLVLFLMAVCIVFSSINEQRLQHIENATYLLTSETNKIQYTIDSQFMNTRTLEMIVASHDGEVLHFESVAKMMFEDISSMRSIQLAPNGVISYVYPLEGNEKAFIDLFADPDRRDEAIWSRDTGNMTLSGPYELAQGGMGVIVRRPIYLETHNGEHEFWGFSTIVLDVPEIFDDADLDLLTDRNYYYRIWRYLPGTEEIQTITANTDKDISYGIRGEISVPNNLWYIDIAPADGWVPFSQIIIKSLIALVIVILSTLTLAGVLTSLNQREELIQQTNTDALTGLKNSRFFMNTLKEFSAEQKHFTVFYLDMNNFKQINDKYGHDVGDLVLKEVANRIKNCIRDGDIASRIGGDEFTIILSGDTSPDICALIKERLKKSISRPCTLSNIPFSLDISVGFARCPDDHEDMEKVIRIADQRMYEEKKLSKM